jgi:hypothetical protein
VSVIILVIPPGIFIVIIKSALLVVEVLCIGQFIWTLFSEQKLLGIPSILISILAVAICLGGFELLRRWGGKLAGERQALPANHNGKNTTASSFAK